MALAHESRLCGIRILRRGYNFTDGSDAFGHLCAGLLFIAFILDAHRQFVPMRRAAESPTEDATRRALWPLNCPSDGASNPRWLVAMIPDIAADVTEHGCA